MKRLLCTVSTVPYFIHCLLSKGANIIGAPRAPRDLWFILSPSLVEVSHQLTGSATSPLADMSPSPLMCHWVTPPPTQVSPPPPVCQPPTPFQQYGGIAWLGPSFVEICLFLNRQHKPSLSMSTDWQSSVKEDHGHEYTTPGLLRLRTWEEADASVTLSLGAPTSNLQVQNVLFESYFFKQHLWKRGFVQSDHGCFLSRVWQTAESDGRLQSPSPEMDSANKAMKFSCLLTQRFWLIVQLFTGSLCKYCYLQH